MYIRTQRALAVGVSAESITDIGSDAFGWVEEYQNAEPQKILKSDFTVYVKDGSDAHIYAVINDINYQVYVDEEAVCPLHQYQQEIITNATCTTKGQILYTCNWCLDSYVEETDILPHNFTKWLTIAPTCTQKGYDYRTCTICHKQEKENEKNIISHTYQTIQKKAATCTQPGLYEHFCKICNHSYTTKISITDHSFSNWQTIVPTTSSKGYDYRICASCNKIEKTNETPMLPQENTHTDVKKGKIYTVGANKYKVTNASSVTFIGIKNKSAKTVTVPNTIKIKGKTFHVTSISKGALKKKTKLTKITLGTKIKTIESSAFEGCKKLSLITIKSIALKHVGKNAFKGIKSNAKIKVPAKKFSAYKKMLKGKGQGRKVKISK